MTDLKYIEVNSFMDICDINFKLEKNNLKEIKDKSSVYVGPVELREFSKLLHIIDGKFVLVSGSSDNTNYKDNFDSYEDFEKFISNDKIIHWFCQNSIVKHPKITNLPIGLCYDTNLSFLNVYYKEGEKINSVEQEKILIDIKNQSKPFYERIPKCYINFIVNTRSPYKYDREEALEFINEDIRFNEIVNQNRYDCWRNQIKYAFVASPFGVGLDCLRTWEALILGCIPIVRSSGIDPLFDDLPVLIVNDWKEVTEELLNRTINEFKKKKFNYKKLKLKYWKEKIDSYKDSHKFIENFTNNMQPTRHEFYKTGFYLLVFIFFSLIILKKYNIYNAIKRRFKIFYINYLR